jgi:hypothetical protein
MRVILAPEYPTISPNLNHTWHHLDIEGWGFSFSLPNYACAWFVCSTIYKTDASLSYINYHTHSIQCSYKRGLLTGMNSALSHISHNEFIQALQLELVHTLSYKTIHSRFRFANPAALDLELQLISISPWVFVVSCSHEELQCRSSRLL